MHDKIRLFISDCAQSRLGRFVFVAYLIYIVSMISYASGHIPFTSYPFRFYGERELFEFLNWPQIEMIRASRLIFRWQASKFTDAVGAVYIALPWWVYGYIFESIVKRIADTSPRSNDADQSLPACGEERRLNERYLEPLPSPGLFRRLRYSLSTKTLR